MRAIPWVLTCLAALGCARERAASPVELDALSHAMFRDWEDAEALELHASGLAQWFFEERDPEVAWDGMRVTNLTASDVSAVGFPEGTDLARHGGMANAMESTFSIHDHAALLVEPDQTFTDPGSFLEYDRAVLDGDPAGFVAGEGLVRTENTIRKAGAFGIEIPYTLRKDYRWVYGDGVSAVIGRTWVTEPGCSENGKNCVLQSWGVDAFVQDGEKTARLYEVWIEVATEADGFLTEEQKLALVARGNQDLLEATDEALRER